MVTYKKVQRLVAGKLGVSPSSVKTCWIAEIKRQLDATRGPAHNRGKGIGAPPCPEKYKVPIREALSIRGGKQ